MTDRPVWEERFTAARVSLPDWAEDAPSRCLYSSNVTGTWELWTWDAATGERRQATDRPNGTADGTLDPSGEWLWWFDDTDGDEYGSWVKQPFAGGAYEDALPGVPDAFSAGLALHRSGLAVVGCADDDGSTVYAGGRVLYQHDEDAGVGALSEDGTLVVVSHSEHGDSRHPALRCLRLDGTVVADLWDGEGKGLEAYDFVPVAGDGRLLVGHERYGRAELLVWDVLTGEVTELTIDLPGELDADWTVDGSALLVAADFEARSTLHLLTLATGSLVTLPTPRGSVLAATPRPGGDVWLQFSSSERASAVLDLAGDVVLAPDGPPAPAGVAVRDVWAGQVHALLSTPPGDGPFATVAIVHGGPEAHDTDSYAPDVAAYVDHGYAVVQVNYRGSTGYGTAWRDALGERVGYTELEDVAAVMDRLVADGVADASRLVLTGASWGGYLALLGAGIQPQRWAAVVASVPVADYVAAYTDEMDQLQAFDRALFGGSPDEVPEKYADASPLTYVTHVVAPVLVLAGDNDPRCPLRQVENYVAALTSLGRPPEVYRFDAGHGSLVVAERVRQMQAELDFVTKHVPA